MFCPKCSQEQANAELRFCSRCGFPIGDVRQLVNTDGQIPSPEAPTKKSRRGCMIKESLILMLVAWMITFVGMSLWDSGGRLESVAKAGSLIFFFVGLVGLLRFLYAFIFVKDAPVTQKLAFTVAANRAALPPPQENPLSDYPRRTQTKEIAPRMSVTENTTRLLDEEPKA